MQSGDSKNETTHPCEGSPELNGEDATYRTAPLISVPLTVRKLRIRGALVPLRSVDETRSS